MHGGSTPRAPSPIGLGAPHQFSRGHRKIVENLPGRVHLPLQVRSQMALASPPRTAMCPCDVFFCRKTLPRRPPQFHQSVAPLPRCVSTKGYGPGRRIRRSRHAAPRISREALRHPHLCGPVRCPDCGDVMVAPVSSEFVEGGEIRHHWECDSCGELSSTSIPLTSH